MKKFFSVSVIFVLLISCSVQEQFLILGGDYSSDFGFKKRTRTFIKDSNHTRKSFIGKWKGINNNKSIEFYIYAIDEIPIYPKEFKLRQLFIDGVFGYYTYKEGDNILIDSKEEAIKNNNPEIIQRSPFYGVSHNGKEVSQLYFIDYGIKIQRDDGSYGPKGAYASFQIDDVDMKKATFSIRERRNGVMVRTKKKGVVPEPYNYSFSLPTEWELVKVADEPPPLKE